MSKKKICLVIPSLVGGGMERVMSELANYLAKNDVSVWLILMYKDEIFYQLDPAIHVLEPSFRKRWNISYAFFLFPFVRRKIRRIGPDAVLSFGERYNSYVLLATLGLSAPVYISDRSSPNKRLSSINLWLSKVLYKRAAGIVAQTSKAAELLSDRLQGAQPNIRVIPNPLREIHRANTPKKNQIVALGRLVREKRYDRLLEIISLLKDSTWTLVIVGDGYQRPLVESLIQKHGLQSRVTLAGQQREVDIYLEESRIYALTSDIEGYPNALCEAMAHGVACISFDCVAGPGDIIEHGKNGILIEDGNAELFARELDLLIEDEDKRRKLGEEAEKILVRLSGKVVFEQYLEFILSRHI
jgi:GalNAc-alpha-(1->4)-GalNAc-alpha-(1->3)-diNAcBac-PP-undecaprenol alpha-1,4-N-acetyl-D-galactosaminyltransferase